MMAVQTKILKRYETFTFDKASGGTFQFKSGAGVLIGGTPIQISLIFN